MKNTRLLLSLFAGLFLLPTFADAAPCMCPALYKPVCGADGKTYSNACRARCKKVKVRHMGKCATVCSLKRNIHFRQKCRCPRGYYRKNINRTFSRCVRYCPKIKVRGCPPGHRRTWKKHNGCDVPGRCVRSCPKFKVKACPPGQRRTWKKRNGCSYPGKCVRSCPKFKVKACPPGQRRTWTKRNGCDFPGKCVSPVCLCPALYKPVCGADGKTYSNACRARCKKVKVRHMGKCATVCSLKRNIHFRQKCKCPRGYYRKNINRTFSRCMRYCPKIKVKGCPPGHRRLWKKHNGCDVPGRCIRSCPKFKVKACPPGQRRTWVKRNGCSYPGKCVK